MKRNNDIWEYIAIYVDNLAIAMKKLEVLIKALTSGLNNFKFKGTREITHQLGMQFLRDPMSQAKEILGQVAQ